MRIAWLSVSSEVISVPELLVSSSICTVEAVIGRGQTLLRQMFRLGKRCIRASIFGKLLRYLSLTLQIPTKPCLAPSKLGTPVSIQGDKDRSCGGLCRGTDEVLAKSDFELHRLLS